MLCGLNPLSQGLSQGQWTSPAGPRNVVLAKPEGAVKPEDAAGGPGATPDIFMDYVAALTAEVAALTTEAQASPRVFDAVCARAAAAAEVAEHPALLAEETGAASSPDGKDLRPLT
ncbi:hypothetical protein H632_c564p0, partial [Helicosporidium sp. ATCC 50920]